MPELPEVETVKRGLEPVCTGLIVKSCQTFCAALRFPFHFRFEALLSGARITSIQRRGKYMIVLFDRDFVLVWHLGMSGRVKIFAPGVDAPREKHDHVVWEMENGYTIIYNDPRRFGFMSLYETSNWQSLPVFAGMGPEPLGNRFDGRILKDRLRNKTCHIKAALLDQRVVAGIGNIYACEALYQAGISPKAVAGRISLRRCEKLADAIRDVLHAALASGGSSLKDYRHTDGSLGYFQHRFSVYDRAGQACPECTCDILATGGVQRITQSGRSTFYCPRQQR